MQEYEIIKCACKGVPTNFAHDFIIGGMAKAMKPLRLKEALIRIHADKNIDNEELQKELGENVWYEVTKEMKSVYIKRKGTGITYPVNADEIEELEKNARQKTYSSIEGELHENDISVEKPVYTNPFENTVIPDGYFSKTGNAKNQGRLFIPGKILYLRPTQCSELSKKDVWFAGDVLQVGKNKSGKKFYRILIQNFKSQEVPLNFWGAIPVKFFNTYGIEENLLHKNVEINLVNNYINTSSLKFNIKISESKNQGQFESESIEDEDELTEKELKTLMAQDWSKLECLKKKVQK